MQRNEGRPAKWDDRVVPPEQRELLRRVQATGSCRLSGGAVLSGLHLGHRLSRDLDLFCDDRESVRSVLAAVEAAGRDLGASVRVVRDGGTFVRCELRWRAQPLEIDIAYEPSTPLAPREVVEGVTVDSLADLHANKLTCLLSRAEPRDLVDLYFLDSEGFPPESALEPALSKDAGIDPGVLSLLLKDFPTSPLPVMIKPLSQNELMGFRAELAERLRAAALPRDGG